MLLYSQAFNSQRRRDTTEVRSVIIDPAIRDAVGHHLNTACGLSFAAHSLGHKPTWLGHKRLDAALVPGYVNFVPAFSSTSYQNQIGVVGRALRPLIGDKKLLRKGLRERAWEIDLRQRFSTNLLLGDRGRELVKALQDLKLTEVDNIILPTADAQTLDMLVNWCASHPRHAQPHIHIRTCWSDTSMPYSGYAGGFATAVQRIAAVARKLTLSAETAEAAKLWSGKTGFKFDICRCIVDAKELPVVQELPIQKPVVVAWLGEVRAEKGADIVPAIIERVLARTEPGEVKFLLQGSGRTSRKARTFDALLAKFGHSIERLPDGLAPSGYKAALGRSNIILLPYDPTCYPPTRGSGIAVEGLMTAKPIVATRGTFAESLITCGNGVIGSDVEELASGILQILSRYEDFHAASLRARERALVDYDLLSIYRQMSVPREIHQVG